MAHRLAPEVESELDDIWFYIAEKAAASKLPIA
jgi:hypothetical protein